VLTCNNSTASIAGAIKFGALVECAALASFTRTQGQYLAFIHCYTKVNGRPPAEADIQRYFRVTPPTVHNMIVRLHELGLIDRQPGTPRSLRVLLPISEIPDLV
jgi:repressor LexA